MSHNHDNHDNQSCHICYDGISTYKCSDCCWQICQECLNCLSIHNFNNCPHCHRAKNFISLSISEPVVKTNKNTYCYNILKYIKRFYYYIKTISCINKCLVFCKRFIYDIFFIFFIIIIIILVGLLFQLLDYLINKRPIELKETALYGLFGIGICAFIYTVTVFCHDKICKKTLTQDNSTELTNN